MHIQQGTLGFASHKDTGSQTAEQVVNFAERVTNTGVLLSGFDIQFVDDDHHLHLLDIDLRHKKLSPYGIEVTGTADDLRNALLEVIAYGDANLISSLLATILMSK